MHSRRGRMATGVGLAAVSAAALSLPLFSQTAGADTTVANVVTTATTPTQSNVVSNNTLTGLNDGDTVTLTINATSPATTNGFEVRQCRGGANITNDFGFDPSSSANCPDAEFSATMQSGAYATYTAGPPFSTVTGTFKVGTGTRNTGLGTITCDSANPCTLWLREAVNSGAVNTAWTHFNLQFAAAPAPPVAPAAPTASLTGNTATVNWVAPSGANPAITGYKVTPFLNGVAQAEITTGNVTTLNVPGLVDFSSYTFAVKATNALGDSPLSPQSSPALVPTPTGPTNVQATSPGTGAATVTWTAPSFTSGLTGYTVTPTPAAPSVTVGAGTTTAGFTGLTDGVSYTFVVSAQYGANSGSPSAPSAPVAIGGRSVDQYIIATRPAGQLDIAEACANNNAAYPDNPGVPGGPNPTPIPAPATDPAFGLYPQTCAVNLGTGVLNAASTHYIANGNINPVSVRDLRSTDTGWSVNTTLTQFSSGTTTTPFPANCLAVTPTFTELSNVPSVYDQHVTVLGHALAPGETTAAGPAFGGTCDGGTAALSTAGVMTAASAHGLGRADLTAGLNLKIPVSSQAGTYQAKLTFTVLGN